MIIKLLLVATLLGGAAFQLRSRRSPLRLLLQRAATIGAVVVGVFAVIFPQAVTTVANLVGVGRGTDLVLYLMVVVFLYVTIGLYQRLTEMQERYVDLVRRLALHEADPVHEPARELAPR